LWKLCEFFDPMVKSLGLSNTIWCLVVVFKLVLDGCYLTLALGMLLGSIETRPVNVLLYS
jgi:hypothetical protein